jgi:hypothetical protein
LLLIVIPMSIVAIFANQDQENITLSQIDYWHFVEEKTIAGNFSGGGMCPSWSLGFVGSPDSHVYVQGLTQFNMKDANLWLQSLSINQLLSKGENVYIALSSFEEMNFSSGLGNSQFIPNVRSWLNQAPNYNLIYNSGDLTSYLHEVNWNNY